MSTLKPYETCPIFANSRQISDDVEKYEKTVQRQASTKGPIKHVDLRLCRLCYKTKFADGIGRLCSDCHKRVCNTCGTFSRSRWDRKKNRVGALHCKPLTREDPG